MKHFITLILKPVLPAVILLLAVRFLLLMHLRIPADNAVCHLQRGQHVLVSLTYYGLRLPGEQWIGYHRWGHRLPSPGERVVFSRANGGATTGVCRALPGDTVWIDPQRRRVLPARTSPDAQVVVIPRKGQTVRVSPSNAFFYATLLNNSEQVFAEVGANGELMVNCNEMSEIIFSNDYYWLETAPDVYDIVSHKALIGKVVYATKFKF